jgi:two-component system NtrC family sensor kinase
MKPLGLRVQILVGLGFVTAFAMLSTGYLALWAAGQSVVSQREATARAIAGGMASAIAAVADPTRPLAAPENRARLSIALRPLEREGDVAAVALLGLDRRVVLAHPALETDPADAPLLTSALAGIGPVLNYRQRPEDGAMQLVAFAPVSVPGRVVGAVRVALEAPQPLAAVLGRSGWLLLALAMGDALLVVALGFFVLTRLVVRPLRAMHAATARVSAGDWDQQIAPQGPLEVTELASAFNQMTASLVDQREQLIRSEKLASVGQLAAGVAHEIGNPLAAVLGYVDILRGESATAALSPAERLDALDRVKAETQRIHRIIQDLLAYSRPTREDAQPCDPLTIVRSAQALLAPQARFRGVKVVVEGEAWPPVLVSPGRLTQVFVNLLLNAADAMAGGGTVTVACAALEGQVRISFRDAGPGVPAEVQRKVFDPFFTTKPPGQGTGLGLPISRSIVESYHGTLELTAPAGPGGATFVVTLPAA